MVERRHRATSGQPAERPADVPADVPAENPEESLTEAFWSLARRLRQASQQSTARWDITPSQARALRVLARHGVMRPSELSARLHIAARSGTEVIDELEAKSLVRRAPDPDDRRAILIELTDEGVSLSQRIRAARGEEAEQVFDRLSDTDRAHLTRILRKLQA